MLLLLYSHQIPTLWGTKALHLATRKVARSELENDSILGIVKLTSNLGGPHIQRYRHQNICRTLSLRGHLNPRDAAEHASCHDHAIPPGPNQI